MKASSIGIAAFVTAALAVWVISLLPIPVAAGAGAASAPASSVASAPASAPATQAAADLPVGTLMPVAEIVADAVSPLGLGVEGSGNAFSMACAAAPADSGVVNPRAVVCRLGPQGSPGQWVAAMDSRTTEDQEVNAVRLDLTGKGQFQNALVLPVKSSVSATHMIAPIAVNLEMDGRRIPAMVRGLYHQSLPASQPGQGGDQAAAATTRYLSLTIGTAMAGTCRFGDKVYAVKLADTNGNLVLGEPVQLLGYSHGRLQVRNTGGDCVQVLSKDDGSLVARGLLGHPLLVDGVWYDVKVGPGGATMEAAARTEPTGTVLVDADKWSALLVRGKTAFCISGGKKGVNVPAGEYDIVCYQQSPGEGSNYSLTIPATGESKPATRRIKVEAGQTLAVQVGGPFKGTLTSSANSPMLGYVWTTLTFRDIADRQVQLKVDGLQIAIKDETGKELTRGPVGYG